MIQSMLLNRGLNRLANRLLGQRVSIFTLHRPRGQHGLTGIDPVMLHQLLESLSRHNVQFIYLDELVNSSTDLDPKGHYVCFTIDDGYKDQVDKLLPVMFEFDAKPTMFVITNMIDNSELPWDAIIASLVNKSNLRSVNLSNLQDINLSKVDLLDKRQVRRILSDHVKRLGSADRSSFVEALIPVLSPEDEVSTESFRSSTWQELRTLETRGLAIGSHTCSHQPLSTLKDDVLVEEITVSKQLLDANLSTPSRILCYPVGKVEDFDERSIEVAKKVGYMGGVTSEPGFFCPLSHKENKENCFTIPRMSFPPTLGTAIRYASWLEKLRAVK
ncbi:polysaccharide deacetylase family protein [Alteromonas sp. ASW11-130]|uniref:polysaccharide deacetylase family protein n=1 Tax=Alteromonas sp. ASW11-130 TaxID=3015775 RepID=UPI002241E652|nr:polysaccharide deacetylase family protein [Alteromonas sp. ASW11-130]MCW8091268.1 polysaccharide deacetylase family protein [Alteromonas sp. ASW11-130]